MYAMTADDRQFIIDQIGIVVQKVENLQQLFNKDIEHIREQQKTFKEYHKQHFAAIGQINTSLAMVPQQITDARDSITRDLKDKSRFNVGTLISIISLLIAGVAVMVTVL